MNENLHHLLDGDLPDDASVDLFRSLSESREQRQLFREQVKLQGALHRNEGYGAMSPEEEAEMLARVGDSINIAPPVGKGSRLAPLAWLLLGVGLLVGGGAGYMVGGGDDPGTKSAVSSIPAYQMPAAEVRNADAAPAINRDSLVAAIRDSVASAMQANAPAAKKKVRSGRSGSGISDPTGSKAAQELARRKKQQQRSGSE